MGTLKRFMGTDINPLALQRVVIEEKNGDATQIEFSEVQLGRELPAGLFLRPGEGTGKP